MAGVSGVRGLYGAGLDTAVVARYAAAFADWCGPGSIVVARDPRASGEALERAVTAALRSRGRTVVRLGIAPTPTLLLNTRLLGAAGGVMVTASHNPAEWNGLKFANPAGHYLAPEDSQRLIAAVAARADEAPPGRAAAFTPPAAAGEGAERSDHGALLRHRQKVERAAGVNVGALPAADLKVVVDGCNGAGSALLPESLAAWGVEVVPLHCVPNGSFPRPAEPLPEALDGLGRRVRAEQADLGLGLDPDGDRLALVGPDGEALGEECTLALAARQVLQVRPGPVVANLSTSRMLDDVAAAAGVPLTRTPVGEINVVGGMLAARAVVGGEGNGGVIHPDVVLGRDALVATALIVSALALERCDLPALRARLPVYAMLKLRLRLPGGGAEALHRRLEALADTFGAERIDRRDGLRLDWSDRWVHVRPSNTEPIARLIVEAPEEAQARDLAAAVAGPLGLHQE
jgi:phosphomannomutase